MAPTDIDVMIVGGGPAGLSTWLHLHALAPELAARTILVEKATYPRDKLCGGGVTPLADALLRGLGIDLACPSVPVHRIEFRFAAARHHFVRTNAFRVVRRHQFDHELARTAMARGLDLHEDEAFVGFDQGPRGLRVQTSRGKYRVRVLVGADGAYSAVRQKMGLDDESRMARLIEVVTPADAIHDPEFSANTAVFDFTPVTEGLQGYVWHFPCREDGAAAMNRGICDTRVHPDGARADMKSIFAAALRARAVDRAPDTWAGHPVRWFSPQGIFAQAHVLLVGDAAGIDPALGEGIAQSMDYGDVAANALIDAFRRRDYSLATFKAQLLRHPLGRSLVFRARLAKQLYAGGPQALDDIRAILARFLPPEQAAST